MAQSFQGFADAAGVTSGFRMGLSSIHRLTHAYNVWRSMTPMSERGEVVGWQRGKGTVTLRHASGAVMTVKVRGR
jgi:hypothetical protein